MSERYFSLIHAKKMLGMRFIPTVCYKLDSVLETTIEKLVKSGEAKIYNEKVRFVNGKAIPVGKKLTVKEAANTTGAEYSGLSGNAVQALKNLAQKDNREFT